MPSTTRWSNDDDRFINFRSASRPPRNCGHVRMRLTPTIATSGWLITGVLAMPPSAPRLVIVSVEPEVGAGSLRRPAGRRQHRQEVVAVHPQRSDAAADAAGGEGRGLAAGDRLEGGDRPLVVDDVQDHRRAVDLGEGQRRVEVRLRGCAVADPCRRDAGVAADRRCHRPADALDELRGEVARDREEAGAAARIHDRQLPALERVARVAHQLADEFHQRHVRAREQQPLLAVGGKAHVAFLERLGVRDGDGLLAEALHVERSLALALRDQHARIEDARAKHGAKAIAQPLGRHLGRPGTNGAPIVAEDAHETLGEIGRLARAHVQRRTRHGAGGAGAQVAEVGGASGPPGRLRHVQAQCLVHSHGRSPRDGFAHGLRTGVRRMAASASRRAGRAAVRGRVGETADPWSAAGDQSFWACMKRSKGDSEKRNHRFWSARNLEKSA